MLASDIINLAKSTELRQLGVKDDEQAVLGFLNLGILELHKRFAIKQEEAIITMRNGKSIYRLDGLDIDVSMEEGAITNFLITTAVWNEQGEEVVINDEDDPKSIMTPEYNVIEVPVITDQAQLSVIYRCAPDFTCDYGDDVAVPPQMIEALLHYIGYRAHGTISSDVKLENNTHYIRFRASCDRINERGLALPDDVVSYKHFDRGFP